MARSLTWEQKGSQQLAQCRLVFGVQQPLGQCPDQSAAAAEQSAFGVLAAPGGGGFAHESILNGRNWLRNSKFEMNERH